MDCLATLYRWTSQPIGEEADSLCSARMIRLFIYGGQCQNVHHGYGAYSSDLLSFSMPCFHAHVNETCCHRCSSSRCCSWEPQLSWRDWGCLPVVYQEVFTTVRSIKCFELSIHTIDILYYLLRTARHFPIHLIKPCSDGWRHARDNGQMSRFLHDNEFRCYLLSDFRKVPLSQHPCHHYFGQTRGQQQMWVCAKIR